MNWNRDMKPNLCISRRALAPVGTLVPAQTGASALRLIFETALVLISALSLILLTGCSTEMASAQNASPPMTPAPPVSDLRSFDEHVRPFLEKHCVACHGPLTAEAKLRLDTLAADFLNRP